MKKVFTRSIVSAFALTMLGATSIPAIGPVSGAFAQSKDGAPSDIVAQMVSYEQNHNWSAATPLWVSAEQAIYSDFSKDEKSKKEHLGLHNIQTAKLVDLKELSKEEAQAFVDFEKYEEQYEEVHVFYTAVNYDVFEESPYYLDGVNYRLAVVVKEQGEWKLAELSSAPVSAIAEAGIGFRTADEKEMAKLDSEKVNGKILNRNGEEVAKLSTPEKADQDGVNPDATGDHNKQYNINVRLTKYVNYSYYGCGSSCTKTIDFYYYVTNVLPNEVYVTWHTEALKACAEATKMFGWYHIFYPKYPTYNAAVDDTTNSQNFTVKTAHANTNAAVSAVGGIGLEKATSHALFESQYNAGTQGSGGTASTGKLSQWGSQYWATNGKTYLWILHYYYDKSPNTSYEMMGTFTYTY
ncbi:SpoIID/LytB domain-containing protein [Brevibacillus dissolubilis]|uniref:SpoIID/LytB domain-containing protein n=1 Tax=Brevibacillus dissolubilis TaxID=1844116 RepID=UPI0011175EA5|nr:SpoIID/LytB domain-containing protein [Brevibacillus dissolubilis]